MQVAELCHEIEDRDDALAKAREAAHKAQLQKYQASISSFISVLKPEHKGKFIFVKHIAETVQHDLHPTFRE